MGRGALTNTWHRIRDPHQILDCGNSIYHDGVTLMWKYLKNDAEVGPLYTKALSDQALRSPRMTSWMITKDNHRA